ncbi:MAG: LysR family transcriptional regulator [Gammaproteobacteria bacterium]|nr:LysR family transcriptional regulator [Gammaproteobacteria bacterium]
MSRIDPLVVFVAVVDHKSFTAAAHTLGLTPSAVSRQVSQLEARLGTRLLARTTRSVAPTDAGQLYYDRGRQVLEALTDAENELQALHKAPTGRLRVLAEPFFGRGALARIFVGFQARHPGLTIDLSLSDTADPIPREAFDVSIALDPVVHDRVVSRALVRTAVILCASRQYLERAGRPRCVEDLADHAMIEISATHTLAEPALPGRPGIIVNDVDMAFHALREGMGIGRLPLYVARGDLDRQRLEQVLPDYAIPDQQVWVNYPRLQHQSPKTQALVEYLTEVLSPRPPSPSRSGGIRRIAARWRVG